MFAASSKLKYPIETAATSIQLLHRYATVVGDTAILELNHVALISTLLFLSGKSTDQFRKPKEIFIVVLRVCGYSYQLEDHKYNELFEILLTLEQAILRALAFQLDVSLPYKYLLNIARSLGLVSSQVKMAWGLVNDIMLHSEFANESPVLIAVATLYVGIESFDEMVLIFTMYSNAITFLNDFIIDYSETFVASELVETLRQ